MNGQAWPHKRYTSRDLHNRLILATDPYKDARGVGGQALSCPYYVPLEGSLGADWGVIVNPESGMFARLVFEHADCGCPTTDTEDVEGWGRHAGSPTQDGDTWDVEWLHVCEPDWCDTPCEWSVTP